jgi:hypothetical protein
MAQAYLKNQTQDLAPLAAVEVREAIMVSSYAASEVGQDWIALLRRIENNLFIRVGKYEL